MMFVSHEDREAQLIPRATHSAVDTPMLFAPHARSSHAPMRIRGQVHWVLVHMYKLQEGHMAHVWREHFT